MENAASPQISNEKEKPMSVGVLPHHPPYSLSYPLLPSTILAPLLLLLLLLLSHPTIIRNPNHLRPNSIHANSVTIMQTRWTTNPKTSAELGEGGLGAYCFGGERKEGKGERAVEVDGWGMEEGISRGSKEREEERGRKRINNRNGVYLVSHQ